jgi:hypothetical protein
MWEPLSWWTPPAHTETICPGEADFTANGIDLVQVESHRTGRLKRATWTPQPGWSADVLGADGTWTWHCSVWGAGQYGGRPVATGVEAVAGALADWREIRRAS